MADQEQYTMQDFERQQEEIENETKTMPLISDKQDIFSLTQAYNPNNEQVQKKIKVWLPKLIIDML
jgi:hypothetical protein